MRRFEELDWQRTPLGDISLRRRVEPTLQVDVYEVLLGEEYLMSSLFTVAEEELGRLALAQLDGQGLRVVVGGLGLGCTAAAVLDDERVASLHVVDAVAQVVEWHERGLLPLSDRLNADPRCSYVHADFFAAVADDARWPVVGPCDAVVVDIDHSPAHHLNEGNASFYSAAGLSGVAERLRPGGVFALWSDDPPDDRFLAVLRSVFASAEAPVVRFPNPLTGGESSNTVYVARTGA